MHDVTSKAALIQSVGLNDLDRVYLDVYNVNFTPTGPFVPADPPVAVAGPGPLFGIRQTDVSGTLQDRFTMHTEGDIHVGPKAAMVDSYEWVGDMPSPYTLDFRLSSSYGILSATTITDMISKPGQRFRIYVMSGGAVTFGLNANYSVIIRTPTTWGTNYTWIEMFNAGGFPNLIFANIIPF
jgi:hypothetical protein